MYLVIEIQKLSDTNIATLVSDHSDRNEAESKFHAVLQYAAVSAVPIHSAVLLNEDGYLIMRETYTHPTPVVSEFIPQEEEPEPTVEETGFPSEV